MSAPKALSSDELHDLALRIADDPDEIGKIDHDDLVALRRHISPASGIVPAKPCFANMSIVNWDERAMKRHIMTGLIGYLYRTLDEYEPIDELDREDRRHKKALESLGATATPADRAALIAEHDRRVELLTSTARGISRKFLNRNFDFNPDLHVRGAHSKSSGERKSKIDGIKECAQAAIVATTATAKIADSPDRAFQFIRSHILTTYQEVKIAADAIKAAIDALRVLPEPALSAAADARGILVRKWAILNQHLDKLSAIAKPIATADTLAEWTIDPPANVFHQFDRYLTNHHEQLRDVVSALYDEQFDIEFSIILYDAFKTPEAAREHQVRHNDEFRHEVLTIANNGITMLGSFKENRDKVDYYNKNTEILKRMHDQLEQDHKLGADLMKKKVDTKKRKNIAEAGPDAPGLAAYSKSMNTVAELGAKKQLSKEDADKYAEALKTARDIKDDYEVPDDAIQIDMFYPAVVDGKPVLNKKKFYSQAEKPTFMQDECRSEEYQPARDENETLDDSYTTRVITSRTGEKKTIKCAKKTLS